MQFTSKVLPISTLLLLARFVVADSVSCPGVLHVENGSSGCCVGGTLPPVILSTCPGWPICTGPATTTTTSEPLSCATDIPVTANNYNQLIASASSSLQASGTHYQTTLTDLSGGASVTAVPSTAGGSSTTSAASSGSGATSASSESGTTTTSGGSGAASTSANGASGLAAPIGAIGGCLVALLGM